MDRKLVSVRLEEELLKKSKKKARQEGMTFTDFVSKSLYYFNNFLEHRENNAEDLEPHESKFNLKADEPSECLTDLSINDIQLESDYDRKILQIHQNINALIKEFLNERNRNINKNEDISNKIEKLKKELSEISREKMTHKL